MKTIINCRDLHLFERLTSKLVKRSELPTTIAVVPSADGLQFTAFCNDAVLTFNDPSADAAEPFTLPWHVVKEFAATKNRYIHIDVTDKDVTFLWSTNGIPQSKTVPSLGLTDKQLPTKPSRLIVQPMTFFDAMVDAAKCVDNDNMRYHLASICLRGAKDQIISTDGRQALIQDGFEFPFDNDALCPASKIFASKELRELGDSVNFGLDGDWLYFNIGNVNIWLRKADGKFPQMDMFTKDIDDHSWFVVDSDDAVFVSERLDSLPGLLSIVPAVRQHRTTDRLRRRKRRTATRRRHRIVTKIVIWCRKSNWTLSAS